MTAGELYDRAKAFDIPSSVVDGNDVVDVWKAVGAAVERARSGGGPSFIEAKTYRIHGHIEAEVYFLGSSYRDDDEVERWRKRDPIDSLKSRLLTAEAADAKQLEEIESRVAGQVADAEAIGQRGSPASERLVFDLMSVGQA